MLSNPGPRRFPPETAGPEVSGESYGNGMYVVESTSTESWPASFLFFTGGGSVGAHFNFDMYTDGAFSGPENSANSLDQSDPYYGDWVTIELPEAITPTSFQFVKRTNFLGRLPGVFKIYGKTFASTSWDVLIDQGSVPTNPEAEHVVSEPSGVYKKFGLVVNRLAGTGSGDTTLNFLKWHIKGETIECECNEGHWLTESGSCQACAAGTYKAADGDEACTACPTASTSPAGSTSPLDCGCGTGASIDYTSGARFPPVLVAAGTEVSGQAYGNGAYEVVQTSSPASVSGFHPNNLFFTPTNGDVGASWAELNYESGVFKSSLASQAQYQVDDGYFGDLVWIKLPYKITLTAFQFVPRTGLNNRVPGVFRIYGYDEESDTETLLHDQQAVPANPLAEQVVSEPSGMYNEFGLVVKQLAGADSTLNFLKWYIKGVDAHHFCACGEGYTSTGSGSCQACAAGTYKAAVGNEACTACPTGKTSLAGTTSSQNCV